jgi:oxygen-independent coproporphyrinogen III oxidase
VARSWRCQQRAREWVRALALDTIYIGGGTPSLLGRGAMARCGAVLAPVRHVGRATVEWTAEANPESFTPEARADWAEAGVNRISLGAQTFHEPALRWMGRLHGPEGRAAALARGARGRHRPTSAWT